MQADPLGPVHLRGRKLDALLLEQRAQVASQGLRVRPGENFTLVKAREDHLQGLLHAAASTSTGAGIWAAHCEGTRFSTQTCAQERTISKSK
jgi:hypothetical protein